MPAGCGAGGGTFAALGVVVGMRTMGLTGPLDAVGSTGASGGCWVVTGGAGRGIGAGAGGGGATASCGGAVVVVEGEAAGLRDGGVDRARTIVWTAATGGGLGGASSGLAARWIAGDRVI